MDILEKIELNKKIRKYTGKNTFIISLQKQLKSSKYLQKEDNNGKLVKVFSDNQYDVVITII